MLCFGVELLGYCVVMRSEGRRVREWRPLIGRGGRRPAARSQPEAAHDLHYPRRQPTFSKCFAQILPLNTPDLDEPYEYKGGCCKYIFFIKHYIDVECILGRGGVIEDLI